MGPFAERAWGIGNHNGFSYDVYAENSQHFMIDNRIWVAAQKLAFNSIDNYTFEGRLPSEGCVLEYAGAAYFLLEHDNIISVHYCDTNNLLYLGKYWKRSNRCDLWSASIDVFNDKSSTIAVMVLNDVVVSLLNTPRLVVRDGVSRQAKRAAYRRIPVDPTLGWYKVGWTIGRSTIAKGDQSDADWHAPLHFSRAHWRCAQHHHPKAERRAGAAGWWCWVASSWKGHPDFGIKLHHYTPKLPDTETDNPTTGARGAAIAAWQRQHNRKAQS